MTEQIDYKVYIFGPGGFDDQHFIMSFENLEAACLFAKQTLKPPAFVMPPPDPITGMSRWVDEDQTPRFKNDITKACSKYYNRGNNNEKS